jgi:hypothetical protein
MPVFSQRFCHRLLVLLITLTASVLTIRGQEIPHNSQSPPITTIQILKQGPAGDDPIPSQRIRTADYARSRLLIDPASESAQQSSAGGSGYVFPSTSVRFKRYVWNTVGPFSLLGAGVGAGIDQWDNNPPEWRQGASGYGKRFASKLGQNAIQQTVTYGLSEAFGLDSGFEKSSRRGFGPRLADALVQNVTSRTHSGKRIISAPRLAGFYAGGLIPALTWYPSRYGYKDGLRAATFSLGAGFLTNVLREFIFHK